MARVTFIERLTKWWAFRSLAVGAVSVALDVSTGLTVLSLGGPTRLAAMCGTTVGSTWTYFANRHFAFKDHQEPVARSGLKFVLVQAALNTAHGQVVVWLRDGFGVPYVAAKLMADVLVVTFPQLWLMRNVVFPKKKPSAEAERPAEGGGPAPQA